MKQIKARGNKYQ